METKALLRALGMLLVLVIVFMTFSLVAGLSIGEADIALRSFGLPLASGSVLLLLVLLSGRKKSKVQLSSRYGYLFVTLAWVGAAAVGAMPFVISGAIPAWVDAWFESMSGFTTTGASILTDIESLPRSILLWRATTHWLGGMGIVVLTVAIFPLLGIGGRALLEAEAPGPQVDKFTPRLSDTAKILWLIYLGLTVLETILLMFGGMDFIDAVAHAFATMATGGFSTRNASVASFNSAYIDWVVTAFMVLAGMNFGLHWKLLRGDFRSVFKDTEFKTYVGIFLSTTVLIALVLGLKSVYAGTSDALRYAAFQSASILTTTGFATADFLYWPALAQSVLFALMFIGGCAGSTGGGLKVGRIVTMFKMGLSEMKYLLNPKGIYGVFVDGRPLRKNIVYDISAMVFLFLASSIISTVFVSTGGYDIITSFTATMASLGNIGPGFGLVGPALNYAFFPDYIKVWLSFMMLLGRLEVYTVLILFTKAFWRR
ncbi:MAG: TrkH family potassium uptake protein [Spirochaetes bacterium]|nr:TrkH family potassium uptake protein [Spirochaetota bacterium]MBU0956823.1 TrkH family potassium uptake protein [Spirochaetota bacterium]